jgi:hypothetical protein
MRAFKGAVLAFLVVTATAAQAPDPPLAETRLSVHTLLREDIFAGFLDDNMDRFARAERNIEVLLKERPAQRANLLAWKAGATLYRAVLAHEAGKPDEFERLFAEARTGFADAAALSSGNEGVSAITGGTLATFADRLPQKHRAAAWSQAYDSYSLLWKQQGAGIEQLPVHFKGEVLAGLTQSAQRTGRSEEAAQFLDKMLAVLPNTPFEPMAKKWKADPASAATTNLTCKNCHGAGRLSARLKTLEK